MIAVDTNILIYAFRQESSHGKAMAEKLATLVNSGTAFAICWPSVHEFLGMVTHATRMKPPSRMVDAIRFVEFFARNPSVKFLHEMPDHLSRLGSLLIDGNVTGPAVHDARIAAICLSHGVSELWTADRDFVRFPSLKSRNPLADTVG